VLSRLPPGNWYAGFQPAKWYAASSRQLVRRLPSLQNFLKGGLFKSAFFCHDFPPSLSVQSDMKILRRHRLFSVVATGIGCVLLLGLVVMLVRTRAAHSRTRMGSAYKLADGPYQIETIDHTLHDQKRNKDLPIRIIIPKSGGSFPLIIFSHGAGGSGRNYFGLSGFWATNGYVVIQPTHNDSIALRREKGEALPSGPRELVEEYRFNYEDWINRVADVTLIMDSLSSLQKRLPQLKGKVDERRIGVGGHSYGAFTTQMIAGVRVEIPGRGIQNFGDERPGAFLLLSPQGKSQNGLTESSWKGLTRPMMSMTGSNDTGLMGRLASWRKDPFTYSPPPDKYLVFIDGAFHMSFTGALADDNSPLAQRLLVARVTSKTDQRAVFDYVKIASIAFWDAYLKDDVRARDYLKSDALAGYSKTQVTIDRK
jgi:predicted dienelactone hydrolase